MIMWFIVQIEAKELLICDFRTLATQVKSVICTMFQNRGHYREEFIINQIALLEQEKKYYQESQAEERKKYGNIYGKVRHQSVPNFGGIIVTFRLEITGEQGTGNPFKQGSPIIIEDISSKEHYQGTVVLVR